MRYEDFTAYLNSIRPGSDATAARWLELAKELEGMDSSGYELPKGTYKTAENFLQEFSGQLKKIQERYGDEIAGQIISLADIPACPFPWEMRLAAEHLANGGNLFDIEQMEREGTLEDGQYPNDIPENDHDVNNEDIQLQM